MEALYAFTRHTDDLGDSARPLAERREAIARWRQALAEAIRSPKGETTLTLLPALADAVGRFRIPAEHLFAVIEGVEMDLDGREYRTFAELSEYCDRVASAVGLACIHVWGFRGEGAFPPARSCGRAFQLTNILRDLKEDAARGRVYLPREEIERFGYSPDDLVRGAADERFDRLMAFQIDRARLLYREGAELFEWLQPPGRRIFGMMVHTYWRLLEAIARQPRRVLHGRVRLSGWEKLRIAMRWSLLPPRRSSLP
jgi:phytoene synthase